ncbi:anthranilate phosphoribosyltransferase [Synechococcus sp. RSCCF101]|uniref:anthranilate phosphoribosyltransferase n=1 Tax=Synechococcus sp. RSCCF101 TaxID=2511069 RepID=UPI0012492611|nr:anthranilate phosphoribosyltransferase [Synechococcus sp. RSCCF101]QEY31489.1 anthranilate phosphoribosyltransferase [Synechococcus sp. RSCCF101]
MTETIASWPALLEQLLAGTDLEEAQAEALMRAWLAGALSPVLGAALLTALRAKGLSGGELAAMARVLQAASALEVPRPAGALVDTCGTGGDGADSFNISTAVAFTASACGVRIAKHGNRSASGRVGSADVLEDLGLNLSAGQAQVVGAIDAAGLTFLFAPSWHPALASLAPLRRELGIRTVFNLLGPLVNPLRPDAQVLGVARADLLDPMAEALARMGMQRAVVVHGAGGLDEASLSGPSDLRLVEHGAVRTDRLDPDSLGLETAPLAALAGGDRQRNAAILEAVLRGEGTRPQADVVALNTALVLWAAGTAGSWSEGLARARGSLAAGEPWQRLVSLRNVLSTGDGA